MGYSGRYQPVKKSEYTPEKISGVQGFYYDCQLEDPFLSITLHANTEQKSDGSWQKWSGDHLDAVDEGSGEWSSCYGTDPLARCIFSEDFSYSIANDFTDSNMGNPIEGLFNSVKPWAPMLSKLASGLEIGANKVDNEKNFGSSLVKILNNGIKNTGLTGKLEAASEYLNKSLFVQGTRFSYYNGTQFSLNNMEMKFIAFSDYVKVGGSWVFQSVEDYIKKLQPYVMGKYTSGASDFMKRVVGAKVKENSDTENFLDQYVGFQSPPGGFKMDTKSLNNVLEGTLRLNIGGTWAIENLVLKNMNVIMSRVQAKHPENDGETVPLYAEISLQLAPAATIIDTGFGKILDHCGMGNIREALHNSYKSKLEELKKSYVK